MKIIETPSVMDNHSPENLLQKPTIETSYAYSHPRRKGSDINDGKTNVDAMKSKLMDEYNECAKL